MASTAGRMAGRQAARCGPLPLRRSLPPPCGLPSLPPSNRLRSLGLPLRRVGAAGALVTRCQRPAWERGGASASIGRCLPACYRRKGEGGTDALDAIRRSGIVFDSPPCVHASPAPYATYALMMPLARRSGDFPLLPLAGIRIEDWRTTWLTMAGKRATTP